MDMWISLEELLNQIADLSQPLSVARLYALSHLGPEDLARFREVWPRVAVERRRQITAFLVEITEDSFEVDFNAVFRYCLEDPDPRVRAAAIDGLWEDEDVRLIEPFIRMMHHDPAEEVRAAAAMALGRFVLLGELEKIQTRYLEATRDALLQVINSPQESVEVRRRAVESIGYSGHEGVRQLLREAYYDENEKMRVSAIFAMGRSADPYWEPLLLPELESRNPEIRYEAARACGELELRAAVPGLIRLLDDPDVEVQEAAITALGQIGGEEARRALEACYERGDERVREAVDAALEELNFLNGSFDLFVVSLDFGEEEEGLLDFAGL